VDVDDGRHEQRFHHIAPQGVQLPTPRCHCQMLPGFQGTWASQQPTKTGIPNNRAWLTAGFGLQSQLNSMNCIGPEGKSCIGELQVHGDQK